MHEATWLRAQGHQQRDGHRQGQPLGREVWSPVSPPWQLEVATRPGFQGSGEPRGRQLAWLPGGPHPIACLPDDVTSSQHQGPRACERRPALALMRSEGDGGGSVPRSCLGFLFWVVLLSRELKGPLDISAPESPPGAGSTVRGWGWAYGLPSQTRRGSPHSSAPMGWPAPQTAWERHGQGNRQHVQTPLPTGERPRPFYRCSGSLFLP